MEGGFDYDPNAPLVAKCRRRDQRRCCCHWYHL